MQSFSQSKRRLLFVLLIAILFSNLPVNAAPIRPDAPDAGSGGVIRVGYVAPSGYPIYPEEFNPYDCYYSEICDALNTLLFPRLIGIDPETRQITPNGFNALTESWELSEDKMELTLHLRHDMRWSDGKPITSADVQFTQEIFLVHSIDYYYSPIDAPQLEVINPYTVRFTLNTENSAGCSQLPLFDFVILPAHDPNFYDSESMTFYTQPGIITGGLFQIERWDDTAIILTPNPMPNLPVGTTIVPEALEFYAFYLPEEMVDALAGDEVDVVLEVDQYRVMDQIQAAPNLQSYEFPGASYDYIGLNLADPASPMDGLDPDGQPISQPPHPILGDVRVRQALQYGINVDAVIDTVLLGFGTPVSADTVMGLDLGSTPPVYDPERAIALLEEAGWVRGSDGIWVAESSEYVPDGTRLSLPILVNEGNTRRIAALEALQQLEQIGIEIEVNNIEFTTMLDLIMAQEFDAYILGWQNGYPIDPDPSFTFSNRQDLVGEGFNFISYYSPDAEKLMAAAAQVPNCDAGLQEPLYTELSAILQADQPYLWLYRMNVMYAASDRLKNWEPQPYMPFWNVQNWSVNE